MLSTSVLRAWFLPLVGVVALSHPVPSQDPPVPNPTKPPTVTNRLAKEASPYLRQHGQNPVDWYAWGPEAFAAAKAQQNRSSSASATRRATGAT